MPTEKFNRIQENIDVLTDQYKKLVAIKTAWSTENEKQYKVLLQHTLELKQTIKDLQAEKETPQGFQLLKTARVLVNSIKKLKETVPTEDMARIDHIEAYDPTEPFQEWLELFDNYMDLSKITEDISKVRYLLHSMGIASAKKLTKACKPGKVTDLNYDAVIEKCMNIFESTQHCGVFTM